MCFFALSHTKKFYVAQVSGFINTLGLTKVIFSVTPKVEIRY